MSNETPENTTETVKSVSEKRFEDLVNRIGELVKEANDTQEGDRAVYSVNIWKTGVNDDEESDFFNHFASILATDPVLKAKSVIAIEEERTTSELIAVTLGEVYSLICKALQKITDPEQLFTLATVIQSIAGKKGVIVKSLDEVRELIKQQDERTEETEGEDEQAHEAP